MKKLQNNFTTPEQSQRLLDMGVPAWTADCFFNCNQSQKPIGDTPVIASYHLDLIEVNWNKIAAYPCWSAGRLIEIWELCTSTEFKRWLYNGVFMPLIDDCITHFRFALKPDTKINFNFSKLKYYEI